MTDFDVMRAARHAHFNSRRRKLNRHLAREDTEAMSINSRAMLHLNIHSDPLGFLHGIMDETGPGEEITPTSRLVYTVSELLGHMKDYDDEKERRNVLQLADDVIAAIDRRKDRA